MTRDLSAFGAPAAPADPAPDAPTKQSKTRGSSPTRRPAAPAQTRTARSRPASTRITLSLPIPTADVLRRRVEAESTYYLDVILHAHERHQSRPATQQPEFRRRPEAGRIQIPLNIPTPRLREIDAAANANQLSRSSYLTLVIDTTP